MVVVAVSGKPGAGTSTIGKRIAQELDVDFFSVGEKFFKSSKKDETSEALETWKSDKGRNRDFHKKIDEYQREVAKKGDVVISSKLAIWILKDLADWNIWLECDFEERVRRSVQRDNIDPEEARRKIEERQRIEREQWKRIYGFDRNDQKQMADLVIDTTNLSVDEVLEKISKRSLYFD